jgi:type II secretory pathway component GspD/PulD (secretin)
MAPRGLWVVTVALVFASAMATAQPVGVDVDVDVEVVEPAEAESVIIDAPPPPSTEPSSPAELDTGEPEVILADLPPPGEADLTEAERYLRQGVDLYTRNLYAEALSAFNRALALDPDLEEARVFRDRAQARLQVQAAGGDPTEVPVFETFEPEIVGEATETALLSAEELKIQRVRQLLDMGELYLENQRYGEALKYFEQAVLIAPDNERAREGLHLATLGAQNEAIVESEKDVKEDRALIRRYTEDRKKLPEGADPTGIKPFRISVPLVEEEAAPVEQRSEIEQALDDTPVTIEFENSHISTIVDFFSEYLGINFMIDSRVVAPAPRAQAAAAPGAAQGVGVPGAPGAPGVQAVPGAPFPGTPGAPGAPGAFPTPGQPAQQAQPTQAQQYVTDGIVDYIGLKKVSLRDALTALLRGLNLDYSIEKNFIWISTPERIRQETFQSVETRYYDLLITAAETLYKLETNLGGGSVGDVGGGGTGGGISGGTGGGISGGTGGGTTGGGISGGTSGGGSTRGGTGGGSTGGSSASVSVAPNLGEPPPVIGLGSTGIADVQGQGVQQAGDGQVQGQDGDLGGVPIIIQLLRRLKRDFDTYEPRTNELLSDMIYNPLTNQLIVTNTPKKLDDLERLLSQIDKLPQQVSIESRFLTVRTTDLDKVGFRYDLTVSNENNRPRPISGLEDGTYGYDVNGDGTDEEVPFYTRPDGTSVFRDLSLGSVIEAAANPGPAGNFSLTGILRDNADGDQLQVTFDFLNQLTESELLSAPRVTTMNGRPAFITDEVLETFATGVLTEIETSEAGFGGSPVASLTESLEFTTYRFGVGLAVTPLVVAGENIRLWVKPEVATPTGEKTFTQRSVQGDTVITSTLTYPTTSFQNIHTNVIVHDGDTLVLGGLVTDNTSSGNEKLPYLADVPVLGWFFRGKSREVRQSSLLIFVTPTIIDPSGARVLGAQ